MFHHIAAAAAAAAAVIVVIIDKFLSCDNDIFVLVCCVGRDEKVRRKDWSDRCFEKVGIGTCREATNE